MNLKLLFFCLFLAVLLIPAELKRKKKKHDHHADELRGHHKRGRFEDIINDIFFTILDGPEGHCDPNPCLHNGVCEEKEGRKRNFKCDCPKPFKGKKCQRGPKACRRGRCGRGECVLTSTRPFYECKCKAPFQPPHCRSYTLCEPNPCRNGGKCVNEGNDFDCLCPAGFRGRFCHVGPDDCYVGDGESYRGTVSETDDDHECLYWNSHFILEKGVDPFNSFEDQDGLGPHNFCRNPDGESIPWCFYRKGPRLLWDTCNVTECPVPTGETLTDIVPTGIAPTVIVPTVIVPTIIVPTDAAPQPEIPPIVPVNSKDPTQAPKTSPPPIEDTFVPTASPGPQQFATCGMAQPKKKITRIFGGLKVPPGAVPWQVSLQVKPKNSRQRFTHTCGGVLIESCSVLTAGHCIQSMKDMQVVLGSLSLNDEDPAEQVIKVEEAILHENYRETAQAVYNDIALLRLEGTDGVCANETQFVKTACLPDGQLPDGMGCKISGWGSTEESKAGSDHLLEANVMLINQEKCAESDIYGSVLDDTMFCAGHLMGGVDSCQGDSGGPLTCEQNTKSVVYGLVSWGDKCGRKNKPGVYTRVTHFLDWIESKTQAEST
ncbi:Hyaluronan-binding protein 2 [Dissostichus eleginoides]|uniref:trypsin n=1 Tax=Dissostichus eleginoides TaxID=100907 RepID=A0AAD9CMA8_DISEL|nr:Hyaluronan-binding protein 2 [Dissostichus eleginoides]